MRAISAKSIAVRALNDAFRQTFVGGSVSVTIGFQQLDKAVQRQLLKAVRDFNAFDESNDPHGEHDFGSVQIDQAHVFWKIDYYDRALAGGSEDPGDPRKTTRILTIMLASEY